MSIIQKKGIYSIITLLRNIGNSLGVTYHLESDVTQIISKDGYTAGIQLADGQVIDADIVISNADLHHTETKLLKAKDQSYPEKYWQKKESGISALLLYLGVEGELPQLEHHNLFFVDNWESNFESIYSDKEIPKSASLYVCKPSATDQDVAPDGSENLFVLVPLPTGLTLSLKEKDMLAKRFIKQLATSIKQPNLAKRITYQEVFGPDDFESTYNAWQGTALGVSHLLKQSAFWRTPNKSKKVKGLYYVGGNTMPGVGLPMCLISAELVYKRITGDRRGGPINSIKRIRS